MNTRISQSLIAVVIGILLLTACSKNFHTPNNFEASGKYMDRVILEWDIVEQATGYRIYRTEDLGLEYTLYGDVTETSFEDVNVVEGTDYYYTISAYNSEEETDRSDYVIGRVVDQETATFLSFSDLAHETGGELYEVNDATEVPPAIIEIINEHAHENGEIVFLIDHTGSMGDDIGEMQTNITNIINSLPPGVRLGAGAYKDQWEDTPWYTSTTDFTTDYSIVTDYINTLNARGGGDAPESVYDGIVEVLNGFSWSGSRDKMIIVVGDAPPLVGSLSVNSERDVLNMATNFDVTVNLYPILIR